MEKMKMVCGSSKKYCLLDEFSFFFYLLEVYIFLLCVVNIQTCTYIDWKFKRNSKMDNPIFEPIQIAIKLIPNEIIIVVIKRYHNFAKRSGCLAVNWFVYLFMIS